MGFGRLVSGSGKYRKERGVYGAYNLPAEVTRRVVRGKKGERDTISINAFELLGMVLTAYVMKRVRGERPEQAQETVLMRGDSVSALTWIKKYEGGALMKLLGILEAMIDLCFQAKHIKGKANIVADAITRWRHHEIQRKLTKSVCNFLAGAGAGRGGTGNMWGVFAIGYTLDRLPSRPDRPTKRIEKYG